MSLKLKYAGFLMRHGINFWGPFMGAGIKVVDADDDFTMIKVELRDRWYNRNIVGVHFGGSLYAMCDPFYMGMLLHHLGRDFVIWDKGASIKFKRPGKGTVSAVFAISKDEIARIRAEAESQEKIQPVFSTTVRDADGKVVAEIEKTVYIKAKKKT